MPIIFLGAAHATIVKLRCPTCGHEQLRARLPVDERYECERCMRRFLAEEGRLDRPEGAQKEAPEGRGR